MRCRERWRIDCVLWCKLWWLALQNMLARGQTTLNCCHPRPLHPCYHISQPITAFRSSTANYTFQQTASCLFLHLNGVMWIKSTVFLLSKSDVLNSFFGGGGCDLIFHSSVCSSSLLHLLPSYSLSSVFLCFISSEKSACKVQGCCRGNTPLFSHMWRATEE